MLKGHTQYREFEGPAITMTEIGRRKSIAVEKIELANEGFFLIDRRKFEIRKNLKRRNLKSQKFKIQNSRKIRNSRGYLKMENFIFVYNLRKCKEISYVPAENIPQ